MIQEIIVRSVSYQDSACGFDPVWRFMLDNFLYHNSTSPTVFVPLAAQGAYQSHYRWALIKTLISWFFSLKLVIFEKKINGK